MPAKKRTSNHKKRARARAATKSVTGRASSGSKAKSAKRNGAAEAHRKSTVSKRKWSAAVTTDSTHPQKGLFNQSATAIARGLASKRVSPKGPASGMRMLNFYINRAGKNLSASRRQVLEHAKDLLSERIARQKKAA